MIKYNSVFCRMSAFTLGTFSIFWCWYVRVHLGTATFIWILFPPPAVTHWWLVGLGIPLHYSMNISWLRNKIIHSHVKPFPGSVLSLLMTPCRHTHTHTRSMYFSIRTLWPVITGFGYFFVSSPTKVSCCDPYIYLETPLRLETYYLPLS